MKNIREFALELEGGKVAYLPGDVLHGELFLCLKQPLDIKCMKLLLHGEGQGAILHQALETGKNEVGDISGDDQNIDGSSKEPKSKREVMYKNTNKKLVLVDIKLVIFGKDGARDDELETHASGRYAYEFEFNIPKNLPSSFRSPPDKNLGFVRYHLKAVIQRPNKRDKLTKMRVVINHPLDPTRPELAYQPGSKLSKEISSGCVPAGTLAFEGYLNQTVYQQGGRILINAVADNGSTRFMKEMYAKLIRRVCHKARFGTKIYTQDAAATRGQRVPPHQTIAWKNRPMRIPPVGPSIAGDGDVKVDYIVRVGMYEDMGNEIHVDLPVVIGTIAGDDETENETPKQKKIRPGLHLIKAHAREKFRRELQSRLQAHGSGRPEEHLPATSQPWDRRYAPPVGTSELDEEPITATEVGGELYAERDGMTHLDALDKDARKSRGKERRSKIPRDDQGRVQPPSLNKDMGDEITREKADGAALVERPTLGGIARGSDQDMIPGSKAPQDQKGGGKIQITDRKDDSHCLDPEERALKFGTARDGVMLTSKAAPVEASRQKVGNESSKGAQHEELPKQWSGTSDIEKNRPTLSSKQRPGEKENPVKKRQGEDVKITPVGAGLHQGAAAYGSEKDSSLPRSKVLLEETLEEDGWADGEKEQISLQSKAASPDANGKQLVDTSESPIIPLSPLRDANASVDEEAFLREFEKLEDKFRSESPSRKTKASRGLSASTEQLPRIEGGMRTETEQEPHEASIKLYEAKGLKPATKRMAGGKDELRFQKQNNNQTHENEEKKGDETGVYKDRDEKPLTHEVEFGIQMPSSEINAEPDKQFKIKENANFHGRHLGKEPAVKVSFPSGMDEHMIIESSKLDHTTGPIKQPKPGESPGKDESLDECHGQVRLQADPSTNGEKKSIPQKLDSAPMHVLKVLEDPIRKTGFGKAETKDQAHPKYPEPASFATLNDTPLRERSESRPASCTESKMDAKDESRGLSDPSEQHETAPTAINTVPDTAPLPSLSRRSEHIPERVAQQETVPEVGESSSVDTSENGDTSTSSESGFSTSPTRSEADPHEEVKPRDADTGNEAYLYARSHEGERSRGGSTSKSLRSGDAQLRPGPSIGDGSSSLLPANFSSGSVIAADGSLRSGSENAGGSETKSTADIPHPRSGSADESGPNTKVDEEAMPAISPQAQTADADSHRKEITEADQQKNAGFAKKAWDIIRSFIPKFSRSADDKAPPDNVPAATGDEDAKFVSENVSESGSAKARSSDAKIPSLNAQQTMGNIENGKPGLNNTGIKGAANSIDDPDSMLSGKTDPSMKSSAQPISASIERPHSGKSPTDAQLKHIRDSKNKREDEPGTFHADGKLMEPMEHSKGPRMATSTSKNDSRNQGIEDLTVRPSEAPFVQSLEESSLPRPYEVDPEESLDDMVQRLDGSPIATDVAKPIGTNGKKQLPAGPRYGVAKKESHEIPALRDNLGGHKARKREDKNFPFNNDSNIVTELGRIDDLFDLSATESEHVSTKNTQARQITKPPGVGKASAEKSRLSKRDKLPIAESGAKTMADRAPKPGKIKSSGIAPTRRKYGSIPKCEGRYRGYGTGSSSRLTPVDSDADETHGSPESIQDRPGLTVSKPVKAFAPNQMVSHKSKVKVFGKPRAASASRARWSPPATGKKLGPRRPLMRTSKYPTQHQGKQLTGATSDETSLEWEDGNAGFNETALSEHYAIAPSRKSKPDKASTDDASHEGKPGYSTSPYTKPISLGAVPVSTKINETVVKTPTAAHSSKDAPAKEQKDFAISDSRVANEKPNQDDKIDPGKTFSKADKDASASAARDTVDEKSNAVPRNTATTTKKPISFKVPPKYSYTGRAPKVDPGSTKASKQPVVKVPWVLTKPNPGILGDLTGSFGNTGKRSATPVKAGPRAKPIETAKEDESSQTDEISFTNQGRQGIESEPVTETGEIPEAPGSEPSSLKDEVSRRPKSHVDSAVKNYPDEAKDILTLKRNMEQQNPMIIEVKFPSTPATTGQKPRGVESAGAREIKSARKPTDDLISHPSSVLAPERETVSPILRSIEKPQRADGKKDDDGERPSVILIDRRHPDLNVPVEESTEDVAIASNPSGVEDRGHEEKRLPQVGQDADQKSSYKDPKKQVMESDKGTKATNKGSSSTDELQTELQLQNRASSLQDITTPLEHKPAQSAERKTTAAFAAAETIDSTLYEDPRIARGKRDDSVKGLVVKSKNVHGHQNKRKSTNLPKQKIVANQQPEKRLYKAEYNESLSTNLLAKPIRLRSRQEPGSVTQAGKGRPQSRRVGEVKEERDQVARVKPVKTKWISKRSQPVTGTKVKRVSRNEKLKHPRFEAKRSMLQGAKPKGRAIGEQVDAVRDRKGLTDGVFLTRGNSSDRLKSIANDDKGLVLGEYPHEQYAKLIKKRIIESPYRSEKQSAQTKRQQVTEGKSKHGLPDLQQGHLTVVGSKKAFEGQEGRLTLPTPLVDHPRQLPAIPSCPLPEPIVERSPNLSAAITTTETPSSLQDGNSPYKVLHKSTGSVPVTKTGDGERLATPAVNRNARERDLELTRDAGSPGVQPKRSRQENPPPRQASEAWEITFSPRGRRAIQQPPNFKASQRQKRRKQKPVDTAHDDAMKLILPILPGGAVARSNPENDRFEQRKPDQSQITLGNRKSHSESRDLNENVCPIIERETPKTGSDSSAHCDLSPARHDTKVMRVAAAQPKVFKEPSNDKKSCTVAATSKSPRSGGDGIIGDPNASVGKAGIKATSPRRQEEQGDGRADLTRGHDARPTHHLTGGTERAQGRVTIPQMPPQHSSSRSVALKDTAVILPVMSEGRSDAHKVQRQPIRSTSSRRTRSLSPGHTGKSITDKRSRSSSPLKGGRMINNSTGDLIRGHSTSTPTIPLYKPNPSLVYRSKEVLLKPQRASERYPYSQRVDPHSYSDYAEHPKQRPKDIGRLGVQHDSFPDAREEEPTTRSTIQDRSSEQVAKPTQSTSTSKPASRSPRGQSTVTTPRGTAIVDSRGPVLPYVGHIERLDEQRQRSREKTPAASMEKDETGKAHGSDQAESRQVPSPSGADLSWTLPVDAPEHLKLPTPPTVQSKREQVESKNDPTCTESSILPTNAANNGHLTTETLVSQIEEKIEQMHKQLDIELGITSDAKVQKQELPSPESGPRTNQPDTCKVLEAAGSIGKQKDHGETNTSKSYEDTRCPILATDLQTTAHGGVSNPASRSGFPKEYSCGKIVNETRRYTAGNVYRSMEASPGGIYSQRISPRYQSFTTSASLFRGSSTLGSTSLHSSSISYTPKKMTTDSIVSPDNGGKSEVRIATGAPAPSEERSNGDSKTMDAMLRSQEAMFTDAAQPNPTSLRSLDKSETRMNTEAFLTSEKRSNVESAVADTMFSRPEQMLSNVNQVEPTHLKTHEIGQPTSVFRTQESHPTKGSFNRDVSATVQGTEANELADSPSKVYKPTNVKDSRAHEDLVVISGIRDVPSKARSSSLSKQKPMSGTKDLAIARQSTPQALITQDQIHLSKSAKAAGDHVSYEICNEAHPPGKTSPDGKTSTAPLSGTFVRTLKVSTIATESKQAQSRERLPPKSTPMPRQTASTPAAERTFGKQREMFEEYVSPPMDIVRKPIDSNFGDFYRTTSPKIARDTTEYVSYQNDGTIPARKGNKSPTICPQRDIHQPIELKGSAARGRVSAGRIGDYERFRSNFLYEPRRVKVPSPDGINRSNYSDDDDFLHTTFPKRSVPRHDRSDSFDLHEQKLGIVDQHGRVMSNDQLIARDGDLRSKDFDFDELALRRPRSTGTPSAGEDKSRSSSGKRKPTRRLTTVTLVNFADHLRSLKEGKRWSSCPADIGQREGVYIIQEKSTSVSTDDQAETLEEDLGPYARGQLQESIEETDTDINDSMQTDDGTEHIVRSAQDQLQNTDRKSSRVQDQLQNIEVTAISTAMRHRGQGGPAASRYRILKSINCTESPTSRTRSHCKHLPECSPDTGSLDLKKQVGITEERKLGDQHLKSGIPEAESYSDKSDTVAEDLQFAWYCEEPADSLDGSDGTLSDTSSPPLKPKLGGKKTL